MCWAELSLADIFVPQRRIRANIIGEQRNTLLRVEIDYLHSQRLQPIEASLKVSALTYDDGAEAELTH